MMIEYFYTPFSSVSFGDSKRESKNFPLSSALVLTKIFPPTSTFTTFVFVSIEINRFSGVNFLLLFEKDTADKRKVEKEFKPTKVANRMCLF